MNEAAWFAADCVCCDEPVGERGEHINHVRLDKRAPSDYPAVGNVAYDIPAVYAVTLVCDVCVGETHIDRAGESDFDPEFAIGTDDDGEEIERVPVDELADLPPMDAVIEGEADLDEHVNAGADQ